MTSNVKQAIHCDEALGFSPPHLLYPSIYDNRFPIMSLDYIRGIVSGKKARYVDPDHAVDLDLVYGELAN
jgi:hypothetical protein